MNTTTDTKPTTHAHSHSKKPWPGAFAAFGQVFEQVKKNPGPALLFIGVTTLVIFITSVTQGGKQYNDPTFTHYENIFFLIFLLAMPTYGLAIADRKHISLSEFMAFDLKKYLAVLAASILFAFIMVLSLIALVFPIIWTLAWFSLFSYAVVDKNLGPIESLKASKLLTQDHKSKVWGVVGVTILASILAGILMFIPIVGGILAGLVTIISNGAAAMLYRWLQHQS